MYGEILFCASLTSSNVGMYIMFTFCCRFSIIFLCRLNSGTERSRKTQINQRHFSSGDSGRSHHIRQNPQMSDAKNFSCNFEERWSIETISQALWNTSGILVGPGIKTGFCSDKAILQRYVITLFENTLFCYEIIEDFSSALRHFYDKGNRFYQPHYYL